MVDGTPVAAACLLETPDHMVLEMLRVASDFVTKLLEHARSEGRGLKLRVMKINPARAMYERLGFVVVGEDVDAYEMQAAIASQH
jgi:hypothetical protein